MRRLVMLLALALAARGLVAALTAVPGRDAAQYLWMAERAANGHFDALFATVFHPGYPALVALPMVLPPVAVGLALLLLLGPRGPLGGMLDALGLQVVFTWWAAVLAAAVVGFPLFARACEQAFAEVEPRYEQVARTLGLGRLRAFFAVTLPLARRGVLYGSLLAFTRARDEAGGGEKLEAL